MDRRTFVLQGAALVGGLIGSTAYAAGKGTICGMDKKLHTQVCRVAVSRPIQHVAARGVPSATAGSWLACLHMVFKSYGHNVPVQKILSEVYQGHVPAEPWKDLKPLSRTLTDDKGRSFDLTTEKLTVSAADAAELLAEEQPLIIGAFGHPVVLTTMSYTGDRLGVMKIVDAGVVDPLHSGGRRTVSSPDWVNVTFISRVTVRK